MIVMNITQEFDAANFPHEKYRQSMSKYRELKDTMLIYYEWWAGNCNMGFWTGEMNGEIVDYNTRDHLIETAKEMKKPWVVLRCHRAGKSGNVSMILFGK
jgi:hypothetical protein